MQSDHEARPPAQNQSGVVLITTLLILVVMLIGAVALVRSVRHLDGHGRQPVVQARPRAAKRTGGRDHPARLPHRRAAGHARLRARDDQARNYSARVLAANAQGIPLALLSDPATPTLTDPQTSPVIGTASEIAVGRGIRLRYVVDRQCSEPGDDRRSAPNAAPWSKAGAAWRQLFAVAARRTEERRGHRWQWRRFWRAPHRSTSSTASASAPSGRGHGVVLPDYLRLLRRLRSNASAFKLQRFKGRSDEQAIRLKVALVLAALGAGSTAVAATELADSAGVLAQFDPRERGAGVVGGGPTAERAAYPGNNDYSSANTYKGYFDPNKCYTYQYHATIAANRYRAHRRGDEPHLRARQ